MNKFLFGSLIVGALMAAGFGVASLPAPVPERTWETPTAQQAPPAPSIAFGAPFDPNNPPLTLTLTCTNGMSCVVRRNPGPLDAPGLVNYGGYLPAQSFPGGSLRATAWGLSAANGQMVIDIHAAWDGGGNPALGPGHPGADRAAMTDRLPFGSVTEAPLHHFLPDRVWQGHFLNVN